MSERDERGPSDSDSLGEWVGIYRDSGGHRQWVPDNRYTTRPNPVERKVGNVKKATQRHPFTTDFEDVVLETATELVELLIKKHKDYGPLNIANAPGGALNGLRVRLHDKLSRLNHLVDKGADPQNESLEDTFKDIANYAIIALLVSRGQWPSK